MKMKNSLCLIVICLLSCNTFAAPNSRRFPDDNPMQFTMKNIPPGLANGRYAVFLRNVAFNIDDSGQVNAPGIHGLLGELQFLNNVIRNATYNGQPMYYFGLYLNIKLICQNGETVNYTYDATAVRTKGNMLLDAPPSCD